MQDRRENQARSIRGLILSSRKNKLKKKNSLRHKHFIKQFIGKYEKSKFHLSFEGKNSCKGECSGEKHSGRSMASKAVATATTQESGGVGERRSER